MYRRIYMDVQNRHLWGDLNDVSENRKKEMTLLCVCVAVIAGIWKESMTGQKSRFWVKAVLLYRNPYGCQSSLEPKFKCLGSEWEPDSQSTESERLWVFSKALPECPPQIPSVGAFCKCAREGEKSSIQENSYLSRLVSKKVSSSLLLCPYLMNLQHRFCCPQKRIGSIFSPLGKGKWWNERYLQWFLLWWVSFYIWLPLCIHVCVGICMCVCHLVHAEVRGQLEGVCSFLPACVPKDRTRVLKYSSKCLYTLSHLAGTLDRSVTIMPVIIIDFLLNAEIIQASHSRVLHMWSLRLGSLGSNNAFLQAP